MSQSTIDAYKDAYRDRAARDDVPKWLARQRARALEDFAKLGFPAVRDEEWKYTNPRPLARRFYQPGAKATAQSDAPALGRWRLTLNNGLFDRKASVLDDLPDGVTFASFAAAADAPDGRWLAEYLDDDAAQRHAFAALNNAFARDGAVVRVASGVAVDDALHIYSHVDAPGALVAPRIVVVAEPGSRIEIIEHHTGGEAAFTNSSTSIVIADGATVHHTLLEETAMKRHHVAHINARVQQDAHFESQVFSLGGMLLRNDLKVLLAAPGAQATLRGLFTAWGRQHVDNHTRIEHLSPDTTSDEKYRGIVGRHGRGVFNGKVIVHQDAQRIVARQANDNLLLDADGEIDTKPELEIYADDVICSHGATVGRLDDDALFYLRSRGLDSESASYALTRAFVAAILDSIDNQALHDHIERIVFDTLPVVTP